jgi:hypothetical protein
VKKIFKEEQLKNLGAYPKEVVEVIAETIAILDENYGEGRNVDKDLGGYVLIAESIVDIEVLKKGVLKDAVGEYTDVIEGSGEVKYTSSLFLLSSDFSIVVITTEELSKFLLD